MKRWALAIVLLAACGKKGGGGPGQDWSAKPLTTQAVDLGTAKASIDLPAGMKEDPSWKLAGSKRWQADLSDYFSEPGVRLSAETEMPATPAAAMDEAMLDKKLTVSKQEASADLIVIVAHSADNGTVKALSWHKTATGSLSCDADQAKSGGVPSPEATMAWLEKICRSVSAK
jgi:hypothetical protein